MKWSYLVEKFFLLRESTLTTQYSVFINEQENLEAKISKFNLLF